MNLKVEFHESLSFFRFFPMILKAGNSSVVLVFFSFPLVKDFICKRNFRLHIKHSELSNIQWKLKALWACNRIWALCTFIFVLFSFSIKLCSPPLCIVSQNQSSILCCSNVYLALLTVSWLFFLSHSGCVEVFVNLHVLMLMCFLTPLYILWVFLSVSAFLECNCGDWGGEHNAT